jgi:hypothetical protein
MRVARACDARCGLLLLLPAGIASGNTKESPFAQLAVVARFLCRSARRNGTSRRSGHSVETLAHAGLQDREAGCPLLGQDKMQQCSHHQPTNSLLLLQVATMMSTTLLATLPTTGSSSTRCFSPTSPHTVGFNRPVASHAPYGGLQQHALQHPPEQAFP